MRLYSDDRRSVSDDSIMQITMIAIMQEACDIMCHRMANQYDLDRASGTFFQEKKKAVTKCRDLSRQLIREHEAAFGQTMDDVYSKVAGQECERFDFIHSMANSYIHLLLMFMDKTDGAGGEKRDSVLKALRNFKSQGLFDIDGLLKFYKYNQ